MNVVLIQINELNHVTAINSDAFIANIGEWLPIDSGEGDRYHHAQNNYLEKYLFDEAGHANYILDGENIRERTDEEKKNDPLPPIAASTVERLEELESAFTALLEGAVE